MRKTRDVTVIDGDDDDKPIYCGLCEKVGIRSAYGPLILMPGQVKESDYDEFLECPTCRNVVPFYNQMQLQFLEGFAELTDSPFETGSKVLGIPSRTSKEGKLNLEKKKREKTRAHHPDKEIDELLRRYGDNVTIHYDSNP